MKKIISQGGLAALMLILPLVLSSTVLAENKPKPRIVSLHPAHTEVLLRLGARDNLVGISKHETYKGPETEGWKKPPAFGLKDDVSKFLKVKPGLVLVLPIQEAAGKELLSELEEAGIKVRSLHVIKAGDLYQYWRDMGALVGRSDEAEKMVADFNAAISKYYEAAQARPEAEKPGVFLESFHSQVKTFVPGSLPVWLLELAGGKNVAGDAKTDSPNLIVADYGPERLAKKAGQTDILISIESPWNKTSMQKTKERRSYRKLKAAQKGKFYKIPVELVTHPTPSLLQGLEKMAAITGLKADEAGLEAAE